MNNIISDNELIKKIKNGDYDAEHLLLNKYSKLCNKLASEYYQLYFRTGITRSEFFSVAIASVFISLKEFNPSRGKFYPYWRATCSRQIFDYMKINSYYSGARMFNGISLDETIFDNSEVKYEDRLGQKMLFEDDENFEYIKNRLCLNKKIVFTDEEFLVMEKLYDDKDNKQILKELNCTTTHLYYLRKKIKEKLTKLIDMGYFN